jgi:hypothetical protein
MWRFVISLLLALLVITSNGISNELMKAKSFSLKDQFGNSHELKFPREKITVLAFADRSGSDQLEGWIRPLYQRYREKIDIYGVAELSAVPMIARGFVRSVIRKSSNYPIMLDWEGKVSSDNKYEIGKANIYVIDEKGRIQIKKVGAVNDKDLNDLFSKIDYLLK